MAVAVVTDSGAALPPGLAESACITVVPLGLAIGGLGVAAEALDPVELVERFDEGITTSAPAPGTFAKVIRSADDGDGVVVVTLASTLSGTYQSACLGADEAGGEVEVVDSTTAAGAQSLVALAAQQTADQGGSLSDVAASARRVAGAVRLVGALDSLDYLIRGGHVPAAAGWAAQRVNLCPLIELSAGRVRPLRPAFGREAAIERLVTTWRRSQPTDPADLHVVVMHSIDPEESEPAAAAVTAEIRPRLALRSGFGPILVAHTGPRLVGLAWHWALRN